MEHSYSPYPLRFPGGKTRALVISYDDGVVQDRRLVELLNQHGMKGTFHLNSGFFGRNDKLDRLEGDEIAAVYAGHEISVHCVNHPSLPYCTPDTIASEIWQDRVHLEAIAGYPVRGMSYPCGTWDDTVIALLPSLGIEYARTIDSHGTFVLPQNLLCWHPTCHHNADLQDLGGRFLSAEIRRDPLLFHLWGHSFEFDREKNWEHIERFCELIGKREDVWYATSIEVADYLNAFRRLRFTADKKLVLNPGAATVIISAGNRNVAVGAGALVKIG